MDDGLMSLLWGCIRIVYAAAYTSVLSRSHVCPYTPEDERIFALVISVTSKIAQISVIYSIYIIRDSVEFEHLHLTDRTTEFDGTCFSASK